MRLDVYLKLTRLIPKRTLAKEFTKAGLVEVNGNVAKSSYSVKPADEIVINRRDHVIRVRVLAVPETKQVSKKNAGSFYELLARETIDPLFD
ncbi:MAG: RNA-binding S4 domain-containing protein [Pyrinomonadaceae bacterium]|nr:RNA-binding S4 domain-containing protein [Pyrinomonadaceae bacterium]